MPFTGAMTALITPWTADGSAIDFPTLAKLIDRQIKSGISAIIPAGTTGESATLTHPEQQALVKFVVEHVAGRCKVIAGAGSNSTAEAVNLATWAREVGADGVLSITPYYNKPTPEGLVRHFQAVGKAARLPMVVYNVPGRTGCNMLPDTVARVYKEAENVVAIKEASGSVDQASDIMAQCDIAIISGDDALTLPLMVLGAKGVISVASNVDPAGVVALTSAALRQDWTMARQCHFKLLPLMRHMFIETNPIPAKTALKMMGLLNGVLRLPLCPLSETNQNKLRLTLQKSGLLS